MKGFVAHSNYHQFYVADRKSEPNAPEDWTDEDVARNHLTKQHIASLCPKNDIDARIISCGPEDEIPNFPNPPDYEVKTYIEVPSGKVGIYGFPLELRDQYDIEPGICNILFRGYATDQTEDDGDYYLVKIEKRKVEPTAGDKADKSALSPKTLARI